MLRNPNFYIRFDLELKINTSTSNTIEFGFIDSSSKHQYFKLGNTQDRWEAFASELTLPLAAGPNQEFASSSFKGKIEMKCYKDSIVLTTFHLSTQNTTTLRVPLQLNKINQFYVRIQQSSKTAFQSHRLTNIAVDSIGKIKFNLKNIYQLNAREIVIESRDVLKSNKGTVKINNDPRQFKLNQHSLTVTLEITDTSYLKISLDSFYNIWNLPFESINLSLKLKKITPIQLGDLVITEIMPDPEPAINRFPSTEYFELHNNSNTYKQANELIILYNQKNPLLPDSLIPPNQTILLVPNASLENWRIWALNNSLSSQNIWGIINFPNLINSAGTLIIKSNSGKLIDSLNYEVSMHETHAADGGHSYETSNLNPKSNHFKWRSAPNFGGSPMTLTSTFNNQFPVKIEEFYRINESVNIKFNINHQLIDLDHAKIEEDINIQAKSIKYNQKLSFNEIYYKSANNTDFIEIFNPNDHPVSLEFYDLLIYDNNRYIKQIISLKNQKRQVIMPGEYLVFCQDLFSFQRHFHFANETQVVGISEFPNLVQDGGYLSLVNHILARKSVTVLDFLKKFVPITLQLLGNN